VLKKTTAQHKIARLRKRIRVVQGGSSSSKTFTIIPLLIHYANKNPNKEISIVSESIPHLRRGAIRDFVKIMEWIGLMNYNNWNKSTLTYYFDNGSFIEFFSADQPDKMRGARRDILFINEANNVDWESYFQLSIRTREFIYIDFNPVSEFWAHTELVGRKNVDYITLTYKDNEALEQSIINEFKEAEEKAKTSDYWRNWVDVYVHGKIGNLQGTIFNNYEVIDNLPSDAKYLGSGIDFGFTNDPTAVIDLYQYNGKIILDECVYEKGLLNKQIADRLDKRHNYVADSAEPKSIQEIKAYGYTVKGAEKGKDSILFGIQLMQEYDFLITKKSINLIKEFRYYCWDKNRQGETLNKPIDDYNHGMDAIRYIMTAKFGNKRSGSYSIGGV
jgi:phage terminase large subunit